MDSILSAWQNELKVVLNAKIEAIEDGDLMLAQENERIYRTWSNEYAKVCRMTRGEYAAYLYRLNSQKSN